MGTVIIGANHRATRIEITLPVDANGDYAYDENGKPVKGRTPVSFTVPRFDCMSRDQFKALNKGLAALEDVKGEDGEALSPQEKGIEVVLTMLRPFVDDEVYEVASKLNLFELEQIAATIQDQSAISVGELLASTNS